MISISIPVGDIDEKDDAERGEKTEVRRHCYLYGVPIIQLLCP